MDFQCFYLSKYYLISFLLILSLIKCHYIYFMIISNCQVSIFFLFIIEYQLGVQLHLQPKPNLIFFISLAYFLLFIRYQFLHHFFNTLFSFFQTKKLQFETQIRIKNYIFEEIL